LPPATRGRTLTVSRATGSGFETIGAPLAIPAGQKRLEHTVEIKPLTGLSITVQ